MDELQTSLWSAERGNFDDLETFQDKARHLVGIAILAPSGHNTQPWRFAFTDDAIEVYADSQRALPVVDPAGRELTISCGAAIENLCIAARRYSLAPKVQYLPEPASPDLLVRITFAPTDGPSEMDNKLFNAIFDRRTTRLPFHADVISFENSVQCGKLAAEVGIELVTMQSERARQSLAALVAEGDRRQFNDPAFRDELASWIRSARLGNRDGMSGTGFGMPDLLSPLGQFVIRTFDIGDSVAASHENMIVDGTPMLGLLVSKKDDVKDWIRTGQALSKVLLYLTANGLTSSYLNQPIETPDLRDDVRKIAGVSKYPQILLRIGEVDEIPQPSVRRSTDEVIR